MTSHCRGEKRILLRRIARYRSGTLRVAINSIAQQASPSALAKSEFLRTPIERGIKSRKITYAFDLRIVRC